MFCYIGYYYYFFLIILFLLLNQSNIISIVLACFCGLLVLLSSLYLAVKEYII
jgi:hypothetical protein